MSGAASAAAAAAASCPGRARARGATARRRQRVADHPAHLLLRTKAEQEGAVGRHRGDVGEGQYPDVGLRRRSGSPQRPPGRTAGRGSPRRLARSPRSAAWRAPSGVPPVSRGSSTRSLSPTSNSAIWAASSMSRPSAPAGPDSGSSRPTRTSGGSSSTGCACCLRAALPCPWRRLPDRAADREPMRSSRGSRASGSSPQPAQARRPETKARSDRPSGRQPNDQAPGSKLAPGLAPGRHPDRQPRRSVAARARRARVTPTSSCARTPE